MDTACLYLRSMAYNNAWANHRLLGAVCQLSRKEFEAPRIGFFPSLKATLNHIYIVDWFYIDAMEGGTLGQGAFVSDTPFNEPLSLKEAQAAMDRRLISLTEALDQEALGSIVPIQRETRVQAERTDRILLHLFQHQIHHRGQAHAMLSSTRIDPPQLDEFFMEDETALRAPDFTALGFTEQGIWQPD